MAESITIKLGGRDFIVRPLTFRQLREIEAAIDASTKAGAVSVEFDAQVDIIAAALSRCEPPMTREQVLDLEVTKPQVGMAMRAILKASGYLEGDQKPGEAPAGSE